MCKVSVVRTQSTPPGNSGRLQGGLTPGGILSWLSEIGEQACETGAALDADAG